MSTLQRTPEQQPVPTLTPVSTSEPELIRQEREALREILRLVAERAATETEVEGKRAARDEKAEADYANARRKLADRFQASHDALRQDDETRRRQVIDTAIAGESAAKHEFARASRRIAADFDTAREQARTQHQRTVAETTAAFDASEREALAKNSAARKPIDEVATLIDAMRERLDAVFEDYEMFGLKPAPATPTPESYNFDDPVGKMFARLHKSEPDLKLLEELVIPKSVKGKRSLWLFAIVPLALVVPFLKAAGPAIGLALAMVVGGALAYLLRIWLFSLSKSQVSKLFYPLYQTITDVEALAEHCRALANDQLRQARNAAAERRDGALAQARQKQTRTIQEAEALRDDRLRKINDIYAQTMVEVQTKQQMDLRQAIDEHERTRGEPQAEYEQKSKELDERYHSAKALIQTRYEEAWQALSTQWREGMERATALLDDVNRAVDAIGPCWNDASWSDRALPRVVPPVVRIGEVPIDLEQLPGGLPRDARLREGVRTAFHFPALVAFPERSNLLIEAPPEGRAAAIGLLQAAMLRILTSLPPGQVRFTIIDPLGIGRNFGAFMHLADFDEALVTNQVWTEPRQIEERLADLSAHMERVTQKYLRNEYASIEEYNAVAGEVAEPYRVVVVADFPNSFDEKSAQRLASIALGGVPCGVITLLAFDPDRPAPPGFSADLLRPSSVNLSWQNGRLVWDDPDLTQYALAIDAMPQPELATRLIHRVGEAARLAKRVEVPFEFISPPDHAWWTCDSRTGIDVALGKSGATKRQHLALGQGTSQHVLVAGRTGSGKSTLLHALITNLALNYSPDQVDLYLIDFKKGVEFKVYASHDLPHASVVAIESEREFGISVLQRLDAEMRARADRFRDAGVQDVNGYRNAPGTSPLPRILLIVDEFQEFFVEEDKVAQEAALLLDRLVRQGRAFGVHVILGSQTLGGAYALARSTLGQMAVRIALQCSEADAHLILSESNTAARLLSRPGEAVYNDANGMEEGNHFFQVVWLPDERRESYLEQIHTLALERKPVLARTPIVFEGDAPAELARNPLLKPLLEAPSWPEAPRSALAWLGDAVAIKDPTAALFRRQGGNHLLIIGQNPESALGIMASALLSLAAQFSPPESDSVRSGARFAILDGTPEDEPHAEVLRQVGQLLPHPVNFGGWRDAGRIITALAQELVHRQQPDGADGPEIFLFIHDLPRFRDLRRREDNFGFSRPGEEATPADHFANILREGSGYGLHIITWCDNLNNLNRTFDHQMLREFEMRVLFQMSPTDSGHLIDAPHASKLGPHRAFFASEEQNRLEKFRPYGVPPAEWLAWAAEQLRRRAGHANRSASNQ